MKLEMSKQVSDLLVIKKWVKALNHPLTMLETRSRGIPSNHNTGNQVKTVHHPITALETRLRYITHSQLQKLGQGIYHPIITLETRSSCDVW